MKQIELTKGFIAFVDDETFPVISKYQWYPIKGRNTYYAAAYDKGKRLRMHWLIFGKPSNGNLVDHIDGNGLNNQKSNLRVCTNRQNSCNRVSRGSSKYLGVSIVSSRKVPTWRVFVGKKYVGIYTDEVKAAKAYNMEAIKMHGEFTKLNIIS